MMAAEAPLFLGVDGGGTRCRARLRDASGRLLGEAEGGTANIYQDFALAIATIAQTAAAAVACANLPADAIARCRAGLGLAGVTGPDSIEKVLAAGLPFASIAVDTDAVAACLGAHGGADGGIVIAGTGSAAFAMKGRERHAIGGWGFILADGGSGGHIGRSALRRAVMAADGLAPMTGLTRSLLDRFGNDLPGLVEWCRTALSRDFGALAPLVFEAERAGDPHAVEIIAKAALAVAGMVRALAVWGVDRVTLIGSVALALQDRLSDEAKAVLTAPMADPADGAILLAGGRIAPP